MVGRSSHLNKKEESRDLNLGEQRAFFRHESRSISQLRFELRHFARFSGDRMSRRNRHICNRFTAVQRQNGSLFLCGANGRQWHFSTAQLDRSRFSLLG
jgi:hypothetical protein